MFVASNLLLSKLKCDAQVISDMYRCVVPVQMLQSDLVSQQKTASAVREEGRRIIGSKTSSVEASSATRHSLRQLDDGLALLESQLSHRVDELTMALSEV